jgi:hypothetical protein
MGLHELGGMKMQQHATARQLGCTQQRGLAINAATLSEVQMHDGETTAGALKQNPPDCQGHEDERENDMAATP